MRTRPRKIQFLRLFGWVVGGLLTQACTDSGAPSGEAARVVSADLAIVGASLIDGTGSPVRSDVTILVEGANVVAVGGVERLEVPTGTQIIDGRGKFVMPGLVDLHVHFGRGAPLPRRDDEAEVVLARLLAHGVTSILQLGASDGGASRILELQRLLGEGSILGPHLYGSGGHLTLQGSHPVYTLFPPAVRDAADTLASETPLEQPVDLAPLGIGVTLVRTPAAARQAVRDRVEAGMDVIKITVESGPTPFGDDHPQMSVEMVQAIVEEAGLGGLRVFAHVSSLDELETAVRGGAHGVVHTVRNLPLPEDATIRRLSTSGFFVMPTLSLYAEPPPLDDPILRRSTSEEELRALSNPAFRDRVEGRWTCCAPFEEVLRSVGAMHARGVPIVLGTDTGNPYIFAGYQVHRELELLVEAGLEPMEALVAATSRAAEFLGQEAVFGTVEVGKRADLLILDRNPAEDIRNTRALIMVLRAGVVVDLEEARRRSTSSSTRPP